MWLGWGESSRMWLFIIRVFLMECVMNSSVKCILFYSVSNFFCILWWVSVLRVVKGLFISSILGCIVSVWVIVMCVFMLFESVCG